MKVTEENLRKALEASWGRETGYANDWNNGNPARGQCVVSTLVVQDYFGGDLLCYAVSGEGIDEKHYKNKLPDGKIIDTTASQYQGSVEMAAATANLHGYATIRERFMADDETRQRYELLKKRVAENLQ